MGKSTRTVNSLKSAITGVGGQALTFLLQFVNRIVLLNTIGVEYLGISGLFTSVITILSIGELGIGTAICYALYKPLAENDTKKIAATMNLLKNAYRVVGISIVIFGVAFYPFLPYFMKGTTDLVNIDLVYALYIADSAFSYFFFAYKSAVLQADQKKYVVNIIGNIASIATIAMRTVVLMIFKSYIAYMIVQTVGNVLKSLVCAVIVNKSYPYLAKLKKEKLEKHERKAIFKNLFALALNKVSITVLSSTDNLIIANRISMIVVGLHSNYALIITAVTQLVKNIFSAFTASIGNLFAGEDKEKSEFIFRCLNFLNFWIYGVCAICLWNLFNPFIAVVWGSDMLFDELTVLVIVLNFLTEGLQNAVLSYKDACGLFWQGRYRPLASVILNVPLSVILIKPFGVAGVFIGTIISRFLTTWWFDARLVHRKAFGISPKKYYIRYFASLIRICIPGGLIYYVTLPLGARYGDIVLFLVRAVLCAVVPNVIFWVRFRKTEEFIYLYSSAKRLLGRFTKKLKG